MANKELPEAAKNLNESKLFNVDPDFYSENSDLFKEDVKMMNTSTLVTRGVANYANENSQQASIVSEDGEKLSYLERYYKFAESRIFNIPSTQRKVSEITNKYFTGEEVTDHDKLSLEVLNEDLEEESTNDFGIKGTFEALPVHVASGVGEILRGFDNNKALVSSIVGAQTLSGVYTGATLGSAAGGVGALPGGIAGGTTGFVTGLGNATLAAGFLDGYLETRNQMFNTLSNLRDKKGNLVELDIDQRKNTAIAVGLVTGIATGALGKLLIGQTPFIKNLRSPKFVVNMLANPARRAKMEALGSILKSTGSGAAGGGVIELAKVIGEELNKGEEFTEETFFNALDRVGNSMLVGGATTGTISAGLNAGTLKANTKRYQEQNNFVKRALGDNKTIVVREDGSWNIETILNPEKQDQNFTPNIEDTRISKSVKALETQDIMNEMAALANTTEIKKTSKGEFSNIKKSIFKLGGIDQNVFIDMEDMRRFANEPEKGQAAADLMKNLGVNLDEQPNAPVQIPFRQAMDLVEDYPELSDYLRANPESPNPLEAKNYLTRLNEARTQRVEKFDSLGIPKDRTPEQEAELNNILKPVDEAAEALNEFDYFDKPVFTDNIESALNPKEVEEFNTAYLDAKLEISKTMKAEVENDFTRQRKAISKEILSEENRRNEVALEKDLTTIEYFNPKNTRDKILKESLKLNHKKKGYSPFAIDPIHLPKEIRDAFINEPTLKKRKVFVEGGLTPDETAHYLGLDNGEQAIKLLANTPDRKAVKKGKVQRKIDIDNQVDQAFKPERIEAIDKAYSNKSKLHRKEMKFMMENKQVQTKRGVKRIALPLPKIPEINRKAYNIVNETKVKDLNVKKFQVGEAGSQRKAVNSFLNGDFEQAFIYKENAILNNEIAKETQKAAIQVEKNNKVFKDIQKPNNVKALKKTGYYDAVDEIMDLWSLNPSRKGLSKKGEFDKAVEKLVFQGKGNFIIPEEFNDVRENITEASVEQHSVIANTLRGLLHQAKAENKLLTKIEAMDEARTLETLVEGSSVRLVEHPKYDINKAFDSDKGNLNLSEYASVVLNTTKNLNVSAQSIILELDQQELGGYHDKIITSRINQQDVKKLEDIKQHMTKVENAGVKIYGEKGYEKLWNEFLNIDEFKDYPTLAKEGRIRKTKLIDLLAYMGDPDGRKQIEKFTTSDGTPLSFEKFMEIAENYLTEEDARFAQFTSDNYKTYAESSRQLQIRTTGEDVTMVQGIPWTFKGKVYPGGYYPLKYQRATEDAKLQQRLRRQVRKLTERTERAFGVSQDEDYSYWASQKMTNQGRLKEREGSIRPLRLDLRKSLFDGIEEVIHDENFRELGVDLSKLFADPEFSKNAKAVVGSSKYGILYNSVFEKVGRMKQDTKFFQEQQDITDRLIGNFQSGLAIGTMAYSWSSVVIQTASLPNVGLLLGEGGNESLISTLVHVSKNLDKIDEFVSLAHDAYPQLKYGRDRIDDTMMKTAAGNLPRELSASLKGTSPTVRATIDKYHMAFNQLGMSGMSQMDDFMKMLGVLATVKHFSDGNAKNYPIEKLYEMSESEKSTALKEYVRQTIKQSLTSSDELSKTPLEKIIIGKPFTKFFADARNALLVKGISARRIQYSSEQAWEKAKRKEYRAASKQAGKTLKAVFAFFATTSAIQMLIDNARDEETPLSNITDLTTLDNWQERAQQTASYVLKAPINTATDEMPVIRDLKYAANSKRRTDYRNVSIPLMRSLSDGSTTIKAVGDYYEDLIDYGITDAGLPDFSKAQTRSLSFGVSYMIGGMPVNGIMKMLNALESETAASIGNAFTMEAERVYDVLEDFITLFQGDKKYEVQVEDAKKMKDELEKQGRAPDSEVTIDNDQFIEGDWNFFDSETGREGKYGFTEERWNEIMTLNPSLGLTENGRVSKDTSEQDTAINWSNDNNKDFLSNAQIPVQADTLYGAHRFGLLDYINVYKADNNAKLEDIVENQELFKEFSTVKSVKDFVEKQVTN